MKNSAIRPLKSSKISKKIITTGMLNKMNMNEPKTEAHDFDILNMKLKIA